MRVENFRAQYNANTTPGRVGKRSQVCFATRSTQQLPFGVFVLKQRKGREKRLLFPCVLLCERAAQQKTKHAHADRRAFTNN